MIDSSSESGVSNLREGARAALARRPAHFIDGQWIQSTATIPVIDPATDRSQAHNPSGPIFRGTSLPGLPQLAFRTQVSGNDGSIPDLTGTDDFGDARLILEANF